MAHFDPLMWVIENPATGLLKTRPSTERLPSVDVTYCKYGTPYRKQTRLWTNMRWRPSRGLCRSGSRCDAWEDGRHLRGAQGGPRLMGGQRERVRGQSRELLYSIPTALRGDCARGHGRACGSAEHPGLKRGAFIIRFFRVGAAGYVFYPQERRSPGWRWKDPSRTWEYKFSRCGARWAGGGKVRLATMIRLGLL